MKVDSTKRASTSTVRGRGTYAAQACSICRGKKTKCDGIKPICGPCTASGRQDECSWGRESGRKPRTEAHFEAMRKRADALEEYVHLLESMLEKCRREHGGGKDNGESYLQFRPRDAEGIIPLDELHVEDNDNPNNEDCVFSQELCLPTMNLKLEEGNLLLHGNTAVFRFAPEPPTSPPPSRFPLDSKSPRYVLLVDGFDNKNYNPDFDWSRYLPTSVPLDRKEHDRPTPDKTVHYSPMLHNALLAVATAFSDDHRIRDLKARQTFAILAKNYVEAECQQPNISVVHALSLLGSYHSGLGEQTLGYLYFGMSARMSQALGLSIDCSAWVKSGLLTENDQFDRNWAFWTIFTQDVCWSLYVGRDFSIPFSSNSLKRIPIPIVDTEFDSVPWYHPPSGIASQPNYLSKTFAASCELLMIARGIMDVVNGLNNASVRHEINYELISKIDLQLNTWKSSLSSDLDITIKSRPTATSHRLMMHCTYWWFFILLHRPFYHRKHRSTDRAIDHVKLCKRAAENIVELLGTWRSLYTLRYAPITLVQTAFSAGTIYLLGAVQASTGLRVAQESLKHALAQAQLCVDYLFEIGKSWQCAMNIGEILRRLLQEQLKPLLDKRVSRADAMSGFVTQNQNQIQQHGNGGPLTSSNRSSDSLSHRCRSLSQRRSMSARDGRLSSRSSVSTFQTGIPKSGSSSHHSPIPSMESHSQPHSQPHSPSFSIPRSNSIPDMMLNQSPSSWPMDYIPAVDVTLPLLQNSSRRPENKNDANMDIDFGALDNDVFDADLGFSPNTSMNLGIEKGSNTSMVQVIDPSRFLAMLGGEPLSDAPFLPTFDSYSPPAGEGGPYSPQMQQPSMSLSTGFAGPAQGDRIPDPDLAILTQFWDQNFA
ncbi:Nitrogen assimilation transcription factor nit-4 [Termitomyces sp. J132]|nr:Nitrogen assimilation transcription factor nit-4 [Termitomyces sp. J132]